MTLSLYIYPKTTLFSGRINEPSALTYPVDQFSYDNVGVGTFSLVGPNRTVLIGSTSGAFDLGITRTRLDATSDTIYIGRSSKGVRLGEVTLTDNAYFTVLAEPPRIWSKVPFIDADGVTFMDSDLDFATYGADSPPVANAGPAVAGTIDSGTSLLTVDFDATNSFVTAPGASISSYFWNVGTGTITVGTTASSSITATFAAGFHLVSLTIADDNAEGHTCYVPVLAIDPASDPTIKHFEIQSHRITQQGQEMRVRVREDIDEANYLDGSYCMVIDGEPSSASDRSNVLFQGWIDLSDEEIRGTATGLLRDVTLSLTDVAGRLKRLPGYSRVIEHAASPANWQEMTTPDMERYIHHLLQWQTNALDVADLSFAGDESSYTFKILGSDGATIFDQVDRRARALIPDHIFTCNRRGQLAIGIDPLLQNTGDRTATNQATLGADDYSDLRYRQQRNPRRHWLRSNAILTGTSSVATAFCIAPGDAPGQGPNVLDDGEHLSLSQDDLNDTTGHRYARLNAPQGLFTAVLAEGTETDIEPADLTWVTLGLPSTVAAQRGLSFSSERCLPHVLDIRYQTSHGGIVRTHTLTLEREITDGVPATTVTIPEATPVDDGGWVPAVEEDDMFNNGLTGGDTVAMIDTNGFIWTTNDFTAGTPTWTRNITAANAVSFQINDLTSWVADPFSPGYRGVVDGAINGWVQDELSVYRIADIFGTPSYTAVKTFADACNRGATGEWAVIAASFGRFQSTESDNPWLMSVRNHRDLSGKNGVYVSYSTDGGTTWSTETSVTGHYDSDADSSPKRVIGVYMSPRTPGYALIGVYTTTADPAACDIYETTDWGATWATSGITSDLDQGVGWCFHVPWHDNSDESLLYYTNFNRDSGIHTWSTRRTDGTTDADISPTVSSEPHSPFRSLFGIQSLDTNRLNMVMAGVGDGVDDRGIDRAGTSAASGIFVSTDGGDTWTTKMTPVTGGPTANWPSGCAFASGNADIIYAWGNRDIWYSTDGGDTFNSKRPSSNPPTLEILGIAGGPLLTS